ncbi:MAG: ABC transporter permease [Lachnospiraceae bacterium]|nr:ABC transporter permease [Lachnospiraceae bacterium]
MIRLIKNQTIMSLKDSSFFRCILYVVLSALMIVMMTWTLGNALPALFSEAISEISSSGKISLGFIEFDSLEQIQAMNAGTLLQIAYASPLITMIIGIFTIESFSKNRENGYFAFLVTKKVSKWRMYTAKIIASYLLSLAMFFTYGLLILIITTLMYDGHGFESSQPPAVFMWLITQLLVLFGIVCFYSMCICLFGKIVKTIVFCVLMAVGAPTVMSFLAAIFEREVINCLWIGNCSTGCNAWIDKIIPIIFITLVYICLSLFIGGIIFMNRNIN